MKIQLTILKPISALLIALLLFSSASAMDDPGFVISRMVVCEKVSNREPVQPSETFASDTGKVYCFLEAENIEEDTTISFIWYYENREMSRISLPLQKGKRWRTFASKTVAGLRGDWKVELTDASGIVLNTISFQVQ